MSFPLDLVLVSAVQRLFIKVGRLCGVPVRVKPRIPGLCFHGIQGCTLRWYLRILGA